MTTFAKRLPVFVMIGVLLTLMMAGGGAPLHLSIAATDAATPAQAAQTTQQPTIQVTLNSAPVQGIPGSYCWPQTGDAPQCDIVPDPQPAVPVTVAQGDTLMVTVAPAAPQPTKLSAKLLDDKNADGEIQQFDLLTTGGAFTVPALTGGSHRLLVTAFYPTDPVVGEPFVSSAYLLIVAGEAAGTVEAQPTEQVEGTAAVVATSEGVPTEVAVTEIPTEISTEVAPTEVAVTEVPTEVAPTEVAVTEAPTTVSVTEIAPTSTPFQLASSPTPELFPTVTPGTVSGGAVPTEQPTSAAFPPTATLAVSGVNIAPAAVVIVGGRTFDPIAVSACVLGDAGEQTCVNRPSNASVERVFAAPGDVAQINFPGPRPTTLSVSLLSSDATQVIDKQTLTPDNLVLYMLPTTPGSFVLSVDVTWPNGKSTYYYRLVIGS